MRDAFITLWSQPQIEVQRRHLHDDDTMSHTANDQFRDVRVTPGDRVYVVGTRNGRLLLLGRITVEQVVDQAQAERHFGHPVYEASDHLIGEGTKLQLDLEIPEDVARNIERESGKRLKFHPDGRLGGPRLADRERVLGRALRAKVGLRRHRNPTRSPKRR